MHIVIVISNKVHMSFLNIKPPDININVYIYTIRIIILKTSKVSKGIYDVCIFSSAIEYVAVIHDSQSPHIV